MRSVRLLGEGKLVCFRIIPVRLKEKGRGRIEDNNQSGQWSGGVMKVKYDNI